MSHYAGHWESLHGAGPPNKEWHAAFAANGQLQAVCSTYLTSAAAAACHKSGILVDIGCGSSTFGQEVLAAGYGFSVLLLLDACQSILAQREAGGRLVELVQADCRCLPLRTRSVTAVLDKGTLDALWSDADKVCMLEECARVIEPDGLIISVSFSSPARLLLLAKHAPRLGLWAHIHVIGGDPARGHEARFVCILSKDGRLLPSYGPSLLTQKVLLRLRHTGSLTDEDFDKGILPCKPCCCDLEGIANDMQAARARGPAPESGFKLFDD